MASPIPDSEYPNMQNGRLRSCGWKDSCGTSASPAHGLAPFAVSHHLAAFAGGHLWIAAFAGRDAHRSFDDNTLTSWQWVFGQASALRVFMLVCLASAGACFFSGRRLPGHGLIAVFGFAAAALFWREPEVIIDSSRYFTQAKHLSEYGIGFFLSEWGRGIEAWTDMPLVPGLFGLCFKFFGETRIAVQVLLAAMFSLSLG